MGSYKPSNAREIATSCTPERRQRAQELLNSYWSNERIAAEFCLPVSVIVKWIKNGFINKPRKPENAGNSFNIINIEKVAMAKELMKQGKTSTEIANQISAPLDTIKGWKKKGIL